MSSRQSQQIEGSRRDIAAIHNQGNLHTVTAERVSSGAVLRLRSRTVSLPLSVVFCLLLFVLLACGISYI